MSEISDVTEKYGKICDKLYPISVGVGISGLPIVMMGLTVLYIEQKQSITSYIILLIILSPIYLIFLPQYCKKYPKYILPILIISLCAVLYIYLYNIKVIWYLGNFLGDALKEIAGMREKKDNNEKS